MAHKCILDKEKRALKYVRALAIKFSMPQAACKHPTDKQPAIPNEKLLCWGIEGSGHKSN
jgi:hypothetical protein